MGWKSISAKVTDDFKEVVDHIAARNGKTTSDFVRICIVDAVNGHYRLDGEHLVPTDEYLDALRPKSEKSMVDQYSNMVNHASEVDFEYFGFHKFVKILREKEYPDEQIKRLVDNFISAAYDMPKYNPRKCREDWEW